MISALGQRLHALSHCKTPLWIATTGRPLLGTRRRHRIRHPTPQDIASQGGRQGGPRRVQAQGAAHPKGKGGVQEPPRRQAELVGRYVQIACCSYQRPVIATQVLFVLEDGPDKAVERRPEVVGAGCTHPCGQQEADEQSGGGENVANIPSGRDCCSVSRRASRPSPQGRMSPARAVASLRGRVWRARESSCAVRACHGHLTVKARRKEGCGRRLDIQSTSRQRQAIRREARWLDREQPAQYDTHAIEAYTDSVPAFALPLLDDSLVETDPRAQHSTWKSSSSRSSRRTEALVMVAFLGSFSVCSATTLDRLCQCSHTRSTAAILKISLVHPDS